MYPQVQQERQGLGRAAAWISCSTLGSNTAAGATWEEERREQTLLRMLLSLWGEAEDGCGTLPPQGMPLLSTWHAT